MSGPNFKSAKSDSVVLLLLLRAARGDTAGLCLVALVWGAAHTRDIVRYCSHDSCQTTVPWQAWSITGQFTRLGSALVPSAGELLAAAECQAAQLNTASLAP